MKRGKSFLISLAAALLVTAVIGTGVLRRLDRWAQDALFQHRGVTSGDIVIIGIDEDALDMLGPYNSWDRTVMASALEALAADPEHLPAVTAVDVLYTGETFPEADARLAEAAGRLGRVVTAAMATFGEQITWENGRAVSVNMAAVQGLEEPYDALKAVTVQGHINAMNDTDGILRHARLYVDTPSGGRLPSMACMAAGLFLEQQGKQLNLPETAAGGNYYVPYTGLPEDYYDGVSIAYLIAGAVPPEYWAGKIVLIGPYAPSLQDAYFTSLDKGKQMYGVEFQANVIQSLIEGRYRTEMPDLPQLAVLLVLCTAAAWLYRRLNPAWGGAVCAGMAGIGVGASWLLFGLGAVTHPLWLPVAAVVLYAGAAAEHYVKAARERRALALEKERIGAELALATRIQESALPSTFPPFPDRTEFSIFATMTPAKEVGGDFYDFFLIDDDHLGLTIGDVSGKGVPAALFMMMASMLIRHVSRKELSPARILQAVNTEMCARNPEEMFVTVWLGVLELSTGALKAANAGHEFPALRKPGEHFELFKDRHGFVIGGMDGVRYREYELQLEPGTRLVVYTDGVPEATDAGNNLFGTDRMLEALRSREDGTPEEILETVKNAALAFTGSAPQFDDLTMLCLEYHGKKAEETPGKAPGAEPAEG